MVHHHLIGGRSVPASNGEMLDVLSPVDGKVFARIASGTKQDIDAAVRAARGAFEGAWSRLTATERGRLLIRLAAAVEADADALAALESCDNGKPLRQARADAVALARYLEFYGSAADKLHGDVIPYLTTHFIGVERVPHGVTGHIVPWNYPMQIFGRSVGAALAAGNATVVKPAEDASLTILRVASLAREVGFPDGALNVVTGLGRTAGAALAAHPGIDFLSFTGSPETGTAVQTAAAQNHVGVTLELGGKSAQVVFDDADLERALPTLVNAIIQNGGQTCSAGSRLLIQRGIFDKVVDSVSERFRALKAGRPEANPDLGPMINQAQQRRVQAYLERGRGEGLTVAASGGVAEDAPAGGYYVAPAFFAPVPHESVLSQEEVFGPVLVATPFEDEAEAVRLANGTAYGLVAGVWTRDAMRSTRVGRAMRAGQVFVNCYGAGGGIELPFGGFGRSGHGREKGFEGLVEFTTTRTLVIAHG
ncbi:aldehyde dehydrogenase family protein [Microvirga sp. WGZ8]|uniref:Aldehyde dehydrogenase family protein n=1 Tax=Microvirga puerhi TaxID=2876078 RepID=A0ABS7VQT1_9HYPH|nr:aldehyde dehydrogenase family protein [Microvirga puerhi]MBZ6077913.1 aldehyde dehydrogenase family protein [Microvirga puerhi]